MFIKIFQFILVLFLFTIHSVTYAESEVLGWLERAYIQPWEINVRAKLDTGALTSSIHATNIETYKVEDELWVRFTLTEPESKYVSEAREIVVEKPVIKETKIKEHVGDSRSRYVVEIEFCLNGKHYLTPVTLADRSNFHYPLLLGRRTLKEHVIVDPSKTFTASKTCLHND
jgi:hypothetical protein